MKALMVSALAVMSLVAGAEPSAAPTPTPAPAAAAAPETAGKNRIEMVYERKLGGRLMVPGSFKGVIGIIDCASGIDRADINKLLATVGKEMKYNFKVASAAAKKGLPTKAEVESAGCDVAVFVVADESLPPSLVAVEDRWALVNLKKLGAGLPDNAVGKRLYAARCRGELMRAFALVCGCGTSQYQGNVLDVASVEEIDQTDPDALIFDMTQRCKQYLEHIGVTPKKLVSYSVACRQGWAPAPTNEVQQAIWDKVHSVPDQPLTRTLRCVERPPFVKP